MTTNTTPLKGQLLETVAGACDGRSITVESGTYTLPNISTGSRLTDNTWTLIPGSTINYKPPMGTKQVVYNFIVNCAGAVNRSLISIRCKVDGSIISNIVSTVGDGNDYGKVLNLIFVINIGDNISSEDLYNMKNDMLNVVYKMLVIHLGAPPNKLHCKI